ncbi:transposase [Sphingopyxis sp. OAS728]|uniref:IS110 family transposase n=1 Tax=Sphingopyxis sp. OAS728 TaxID=2663823 RepID=UPI0017893B06|nr:IS110 family transposase [Sphingopyxis sp. OAS728]MBE1527472.1 transposase [Sphingopyxis sp. OAS728]
MDGSTVSIGLDVGEQVTHLCAIDAAGKVHFECSLPTTVDAVGTAISGLDDRTPGIIAMEAGTGRYLALALRNFGYDVRVIDARKARKFLSIRLHKTDPNDARGLAELAMMQLSTTPSVHVKSVECQLLRAQLVSRDLIVRQKTGLQNAIRTRLAENGILTKLPSPLQVRPTVERLLEEHHSTYGVDLRSEILPLVDIWELMRRYVNQTGRELGRIARDHPVMRRFLAVPGVGPVCAVSVYTAIEEPARFVRTHDVGAYLGLIPAVKQSGQMIHRGRISKAGSRITRTHLVMAARVILGRAKLECALTDWARALAQRVGHSKARVAVARKLAVLLLSMWKSGRDFEPYPVTGQSPLGE